MTKIIFQKNVKYSSCIILIHFSRRSTKKRFKINKYLSVLFNEICRSRRIQKFFRYIHCCYMLEGKNYNEIRIIIFFYKFSSRFIETHKPNWNYITNSLQCWSLSQKQRIPQCQYGSKSRQVWMSFEPYRHCDMCCFCLVLQNAKNKTKTALNINSIKL